MKLTNTQVKNAKPKAKAYKLTDGEGMYLLVHPNGSKYWRLNYRFQAKQKTLALGVYPLISLAEAREARNEAKTHIAKGIDPNELKKEVALESAPETTFEFVARQWHAANKTWTADHRARVLRSCNDPAVSAQVRLLMHKLQQVFSFSTPDVGAECYRIKSSQQ